MTIVGSNMENIKFEEVVKIQVENLDAKHFSSSMMWTVQQFEDKLEMMRDGLAQFELQRQNEEAKKQLLAMEQEIFKDDDEEEFDMMFSASFNNQEQPEPENLEEMFQNPAESIRKSIARQSEKF